MSDLSPNERILRGLAIMATALTESNGWTPTVRQAYANASYAVPLLGETISVPFDDRPSVGPDVPGGGAP